MKERCFFFLSLSCNYSSGSFNYNVSFSKFPLILTSFAWLILGRMRNLLVIPVITSS